MGATSPAARTVGRRRVRDLPIGTLRYQVCGPFFGSLSTALLGKTQIVDAKIRLKLRALMTRRLGFLDAGLPTRYDESMTRTIRRYGNRKLYDVTESRYVTLAFLGERLRAGDDLAVVAHPAGTDITNETLANIVLAEIHGSRAYDRARLLELIKASTQVVAPPAPPAAPSAPTVP